MSGMKFKLELDNTEQFYKLLDEAKEDILKDVGNFVTSEAKLIVPVDTGNLRSSLDNKMKGNDTVQIGTDVEYSTDVEFGTSRQMAQPYLLPAYEMNKEEIKNMMRKHVARLGK